MLDLMILIPIQEKKLEKIAFSIIKFPYYKKLQYADNGDSSKELNRYRLSSSFITPQKYHGKLFRHFSR